MQNIKPGDTVILGPETGLGRNPLPSSRSFSALAQSTSAHKDHPLLGFALLSISLFYA
jgi:hypothetical protein